MVYKDVHSHCYISLSSSPFSHPSNLMLDRLTGKIVHIDFGDCFEVAQTREKYPEKIPFRLTRMLVQVWYIGGKREERKFLQAMEITGIEGNFRLTSERVLQVREREISN